MNLRATVFVALALAPLGREPAAAADNPQYPLSMNTRWTYQVRQEFGAGVHPSGADAALVKGNILETTLVSEVAGSDTIGGLTYSRVESRHDGRLWMTEWLRLTSEGLFLGKTNDNGQDTVLAPPQEILSARMAAGEAWTWKASDAPVSVRTRVVGKETTVVPAGKFDVIKTVHELSMVLREATVHSTSRAI